MASATRASEMRAWELFERLEARVVLSHSLLPTALFYPEGFASAETEEVVTLQNTAGAPTAFELHARYARGEPEGELIASGTLAPSERREIVVTRAGTLGGTLTRPFTPYALEVRADGDLGAALTRSDFGATAVEPFANGAAGVWSFPTVVKDADGARDFIAVYNPAEEAVDVRLEVFDERGLVASASRVIEGERRGGFAINGIEAIPEGRLGVAVVASGPVVAAVSHFDLANDRAVMNLGTPLGGVRTGALVETGLADFDEVGTDQRTVGILNPTAAAAPVNLTVLAGTGEVGAETRQIDRTVIVGPGTRTEVSSAELGLGPGERISSVSFVSGLPVAVGGETVGAGAGLVDFGGTAATGAGSGIVGTGAGTPAAPIGSDFTSFGLGVSPGVGFGGVRGGLFAGPGVSAPFAQSNLLFSDPLGATGLGTAGLGVTGIGTAGLGGAGFGTTGIGTAGLGAAAVGDGSLLSRTGESLLGRTGGSLLTRSGASPLSTSGIVGTGGLSTNIVGPTLPGTNLTGTVGGTTLTSTGGTIAGAGSLLLRR